MNSPIDTSHVMPALQRLAGEDVDRGTTLAEQQFGISIPRASSTSTNGVEERPKMDADRENRVETQIDDILTTILQLYTSITGDEMTPMDVNKTSHPISPSLTPSPTLAFFLQFFQQLFQCCTDLMDYYKRQYRSIRRRVRR